MLSQMSQSSTYIPKVKKHKEKMKQSGFQFLLQSLQRDKQNTAPNLLTCKHQLTCSIHLDPLNTAPVHSFALNQTLNNEPIKKPKFFIENVKLLDRSDISISDPNQCQSEVNYAKKSNKKSQNIKKSLTKMNRSKIISQKTLDLSSTTNIFSQVSDIIYKTKQYLSLTDEIINNKQNIANNNTKIAKKSITISQQLVSMITNYENSLRQQNRGSFMNNSIKGSSLTVYNSEILNRSKGQEQYVKIINNLQSQKYKLNSLISQHEMANIKMFIKINEGQSQEIEQCKKQLRSLFDKYKKLQSYLHNKRRKYQILVKQNEDFMKQNKELKDSNVQLINLVQKYQEMVEKQGRKGHKNKNIQVSQRKEKLSSISQNPHSRNSNYFNFQANSFTKSQLRIESLASDSKQYIESKRSQDSLFGSSIKTNSKFRLKRDKIGINLNALFDGLTHQNLNKIMQQPYKCKQIIKQCKNTIQYMQKVINQQNKQLELSILTLEQFQKNNKKLQDKIRCLEIKWDQEIKNKKQKNKDRENQKQQEFIGKNKGNQNNKILSHDNIIRSKRQKQRQKQKQKQRQKQIQKQRQRQRQKDCTIISKRLSNNDLPQNLDQYRIIATQAASLQQFVKRNKNK